MPVRLGGVASRRKCVRRPRRIAIDVCVCVRGVATPLVAPVGGDSPVPVVTEAGATKVSVGLEFFDAFEKVSCVKYLMVS